jgi:uncharacterized protein (TIGR03083 family)
VDDLDLIADELEAAGARFADALAAVPDPSAQAGTLDWSVHQLGAHAATGVEAYGQMLRGQPSFLTSLGDRTALGAAKLAEEADTPVAELVARIRSGSEDAAATLRKAAPGDRLPFYEHELAIGAMGGLLLAELLVHGVDLAGIPIPPRAAAVAALTVPTVLPHIVIAGARPAHTSIAFVARGHGEVVVDIDPAQARVREVSGGKVDARLSAEPVDLLLVAYQRVSPLRPMLRRRLSITGRRPWRLRALSTRFESP